MLWHKFILSLIEFVEFGVNIIGVSILFHGWTDFLLQFMSGWDKLIMLNIQLTDVAFQVKAEQVPAQVLLADADIAYQKYEFCLSSVAAQRRATLSTKLLYCITQVSSLFWGVCADTEVCCKEMKSGLSYVQGTWKSALLVSTPGFKSSCERPCTFWKLTWVG